MLTPGSSAFVHSGSNSCGLVGENNRNNSVCVVIIIFSKRVRKIIICYPGRIDRPLLAVPPLVDRWLTDMYDRCLFNYGCGLSNPRETNMRNDFKGEHLRENIQGDRCM